MFLSGNKILSRDYKRGAEVNIETKAELIRCEKFREQRMQKAPQ